MPKQEEPKTLKDLVDPEHRDLFMTRTRKPDLRWLRDLKPGDTVWYMHPSPLSGDLRVPVKVRIAVGRRNYKAIGHKGCGCSCETHSKDLPPVEIQQYNDHIYIAVARGSTKHTDSVGADVVNHTGLHKTKADAWQAQLDKIGADGIAGYRRMLDNNVKELQKAVVSHKKQRTKRLARLQRLLARAKNDGAKLPEGIE